MRKKIKGLRGKKMNEKGRLGNRGENLALEYLKNRGYEILSNNYRCHFGEVDIISRKGNEIIFAEVKTRSGNSYGYPEEAVDKNKIRHIKKVAETYITENKLRDMNIRFDVISIELKHIKGCF